MMLWLSDFNACASSFKWHSAITEIRKENHESLVMKIVNHASHCYVQSRITQLFWTQSRITLIIWDPFILGDPGTVSQVGRKGGTKVFKYGWKSPWVSTLTELFPKILADAGSWLGTKNALYYCAQSVHSFSWVLFVSSYTTAIVSITACLAHAPKKCTQSGNFQFDIKSPSDFKTLSARKLKTLFQKYKLELTTGIYACICHVLSEY